MYQRKRYSARVSKAVELFSWLSPAINRSKMMTSKSPVSKSLGSSRLRKSPAF